MNKLKGFTLVELLVVVGLMAILFTVAQTAYIASQRNSRDAKRKADLEVLRQALELYRSDNPTTGYPAGTGGSATTALQGALNAPNQYISSTNFPNDPQTNLNYFYYYQRNPASGGVNTYRICAYLESRKAGDPLCPNASVNCKTVSGTVPCNYGLTQP